MGTFDDLYKSVASYCWEWDNHVRYTIKLYFGDKEVQPPLLQNKGYGVKFFVFNKGPITMRKVKVRIACNPKLEISRELQGTVPRPTWLKEFEESCSLAESTIPCGHEEVFGPYELRTGAAVMSNDEVIASVGVAYFQPDLAPLWQGSGGATKYRGEVKPG